MQGQAAPKRRILVVDDDPVFREYFSGLLEEFGHEAMTAADGAAGLELFRSQGPDLVVLDLRMPGLDGLAVLAEIAREAAGTPVIVVSGTTDVADAVAALHRGAWDFIVKPLQDAELLRLAIDKSLGHARILRDNWRYHEILEEEVRRKTGALMEANARLREEKTQVEAMNVTLRNVINAVEGEKNAIRREVAERVRTAVLPLLDRMVREPEEKVRASCRDAARDRLSRAMAGPGQALKAPASLTPTEAEVCRHLQIGRSTKQIAEIMNCSFDTVQTHRKNIRKKLGITGKKVGLFAALQE